MVEFFTVNVLKLPFDYFPRPDVLTYEPLTIGGLIRARGFAEESGHFAMYIISMYFCIYSYVKTSFSKNKLLIINTLVITALLVTFSVSGIVFSFVSILIVIFICNIKHPMRMFSYAIVFLFGVALLDFLIYSYSGYSFFINVVLNKLTASASLTDRSFRLMSSIDFFMDNAYFSKVMFGFGAAFYDTYDLPTLVTLYPLLLVQFGIFGFLSFLVLIIYPFLIYLLKMDELDKPLICGYFYCVLFYMAISNYWFPWFWCILAYLSSQSKIQSRTHKSIG
ncbi:hypothetical protein CWO01_14835 [Vibrio splendidus]|nr:hypothetical protein CWO01_14835 [Vibrio splendidus]